MPGGTSGAAPSPVSQHGQTPIADMEAFPVIRCEHILGAKSPGRHPHEPIGGAAHVHKFAAKLLGSRIFSLVSHQLRPDGDPDDSQPHSAARLDLRVRVFRRDPHISHRVVASGDIVRHALRSPSEAKSSTTILRGVKESKTIASFMRGRNRGVRGEALITRASKRRLC